MDNLGIIYYTSNRENSEFERKIQKTLIENSKGIPIVSVSQKPIDLGINICVGDNIGASGFNVFRQVQIACQNINTKFVISAEADCCYPPDYFTFIPNKDNICYRNTNLYVMGDHRDYWFYKKEGAVHAQVVGREFYLDTLERLFKDAPQWSVDEFNFPKERYKQEDVFVEKEFDYYRTENPVFQIKTHRGLRYYTHSDRIPVYELPFWGSGKKIREYYLKGNKEIYSKQEMNYVNK